jgi:deazaflavin-dependent oxidoreductase (nitroreductase family)
MKTTSSSNSELRPAKPVGLTKRLYRIPVYLYRLHLGWVFGHRFLLLTHRGRRTGKIHRSTIEVVRYDPDSKESYVISAYGANSDWYRNITKNPPPSVQTGRQKYVPTYRIVPTGEARNILDDFYGEHPSEASFLLKQFFHVEPSRDEFDALADKLPMIAFRPKEA